jgi:hypothetical protein
MEDASGAPAPAAVHQGRTGNPLVAGEPAGRRPATPRERDWTVVAGLFATVLILLTLIGWRSGWLFGTGEPQGLVFTIPAGAKDRIAQPTIDSAIEIPTRIRFAAGEPAVITVRNLDDVAHRAGPFLVAAYQTYTQRFPDPGEYPIACSVNPIESVVVTVEG